MHVCQASKRLRSSSKKLWKEYQQSSQKLIIAKQATYKYFTMILVLFNLYLYYTGMAPSLQTRKAVQTYRQAHIWNFTSYQLSIIIPGAFLSRCGSIARQKARKKLSSKVLDGRPCASHRYFDEISRKLACVFLSSLLLSPVYLRSASRWEY